MHGTRFVGAAVPSVAQRGERKGARVIRFSQPNDGD